MLSVDEYLKVLREAIAGAPLSIDTDEARVARARLDKEIAEMRARAPGVVIELPFEWSLGDPVPNRRKSRRSPRPR